MRASELLQMLLLMFWLPGPVGLAQAQTVVRFQTTFGDIDVELFDGTTPLTVANFLSYVDDRDYRRSFIHRSVGLPNVIQGGGFVFEDFFQFVPTDPPVPLELGHGNQRGTLAMARLGGQPDSATSQWYFNVSDNAFLDTSDGGFAVFGEVLDGLDVVDTIRALPVFNASGIHPALVTLPLHDFVMNPLIPVDHLVFMYRILRVADFQCGDVNDDWVVTSTRRCCARTWPIPRARRSRAPGSQSATRSAHRGRATCRTWSSCAARSRASHPRSRRSVRLRPSRETLGPAVGSPIARRS